MTEEVKKEVPVDRAPSKSERAHHHELVVGGPSNLVMVACIFEGKERFAVARARIVDGKPRFEMLAIVLHDHEDLWVQDENGQLLPPEDRHGHSLLN